MDFKAPYFLAALICLAIPVIIHLFNLRKYKKIYFPSLRMLEEMMVKNRKLSKIQKWALFLSRFLAVLFLVLAFARPEFSNNTLSGVQGQKVLFIDNSMSSTYQTGQKMILDELKERAITWIKQDKTEEIIILTNESINNYVRFDANSAIEYIHSIAASPYSQNVQTLYNSLEHIKDQSGSDILTLIFSDNQKSFFQSGTQPYSPEDNGIRLFSLYSMDQPVLHNVYIDTCYFIQTATDEETSVQMITELKKTGTQQEDDISLSYNINGQVIASKNILLKGSDSLVIDTQSINLRPNAANNISVSFQSKELSFDDQYVLSAEIADRIKVAIINHQGSVNPQLIQAFNSSKKIFPEQFTSLASIENAAEYSLIFFNNISALSASDIDLVESYLDEGLSLAFSLDRNADIPSLSHSFEKIAGLSITGRDTSKQSVADIEINHPLIRDVISRKPDNIQLPLVNLRYKYSSPLTARPQDLMKFRDGSGFITQFNISKGILYLFGSPIDLVSGNLAQSYYFAPVLYKMAANSRHSQVQSHEIREGEHIWLNLSTDENTVVQLVKDDYQSIPVQKKDGQGISINLPYSLPSDGFYELRDNNGLKLLDIGLNHNRTESVTEYFSSEEMSRDFRIDHISVSPDSNSSFEKQNYPGRIWKWLLALVLIALIIETFLLIRK